MGLLGDPWAPKGRELHPAPDQLAAGACRLPATSGSDGPELLLVLSITLEGQ